MKKILSVVITFVLLFLVVPLGEFNVSAATSGYYTYTVSNGKATITECDETISGNVTIPSTLGGYSVTKIDNYAFATCFSLESITIPDGVTSIGEYAFVHCTSLTSVSIPNSVTSIDEFAFVHCTNLTSVSIPNSVTSIGKGTFYNCDSLKKITLPFVGNTLNGKSNTHFGYIFRANSYSENTDHVPSSLKEVVITKAKNIDAYSFCACTSLTSITIPNSVTSIGESAFCACTSLTNVTIGNGVTSIHESAFIGCESLAKVNITDLAAWCNIIFYTDDSNPLYYAKTLYINDKLATNITIPDSVTSIGTYAFSGCSSLTSVTIPDSVTSIGDFAFYYCSRLEKVYIYSKNCVYNDYCGLNCNQIYGYVGSTAQTFADEVGAEFIDITTLHSHTYNSATCTSPQTCKVCGFTKGESLGHTGGIATCKTKAKCSRCEEYYGSLNANNHVNVKTLEGVASTCTKTGLTEGKKCADCDKVTVAQQTVAKKDHSYSNNCDKSCNVCGKTRTVGAHKYSSICDTTCNYCKAKRTIKHSYTNSCDTSCNVCKATRSITHSYKTTTTKATLSKNGSIVKKCTVCGKVTSKSSIKYAKTFKLSTTRFTYNSKVKTPSVTVKDSAGKTLKQNADYTVTYASGRKNVGTYKVTVKMKGNYTGTKTLTFKINPQKTKVAKLIAGKRSLTVSIGKKTSQVSGYQVQYSTSKKFSKAKIKTVSSYKTTKYTVKGLSTKKTYYVRVRTYKTVGKTKYYSGWSAYKRIKTK